MYSLIKTEKSFCPKCRNRVHLLSDDANPAFYICFACQFVAQVGVGPVEYDKEDGS